MFNILVVEDDNDVLELFTTVLIDNGYNVFQAKNGLEALDIIDKSYIDLIIADVMMPKMDGNELIKELRSSNYDTPVLIVTAKDLYDDIEKSFKIGCDDYMIKPVNVKELILRVKALLRRSKISSEKRIIVGDTILNYDALTVSVNGCEQILPQKEFLLLYKLLSSPNKIFTRPQLMDEIWGIFSQTDERTVNTHINRIREKFINSNDFEIITIRGLGYKAVLKNEKN